MSDRHEKWVKVEPGTVIPAGQPYRVESHDENTPVREYRKGDPATWTYRLMPSADFFVDSSWVPPLVLPTEPTWGIARVKPYRDSDSTRLEAGRCQIDRQYFRINGAAYGLNSVLAFAPLTDGQIARIEAHR